MLNPYRSYRGKTGTKQLTQEAEGGASCVSFKRPDTVQAPRPLCLRVSSPVTIFLGRCGSRTCHAHAGAGLGERWAGSLVRLQDPGGYSDLGPGSPRAHTPRALVTVCCSLLNVLSSSGEIFCKR